jgi:hypothetical protein
LSARDWCRVGTLQHDNCGSITTRVGVKYVGIIPAAIKQSGNEYNEQQHEHDCADQSLQQCPIHGYP